MGLRGKLTLALLALALVPLAVTTGVLMRLNMERLELSTKEYRLATAENVVAEVVAMVDTVMGELSVLGKVVSDGASSQAQREAMARALLGGSRFLDAVTVFDASGRTALALRKEGREQPGAPAALDAHSREVAGAEGTVSLPAFRSGAGVRLPMVHVMHRRGDGGTRIVYGYLYAAVDLSALDLVVRRVSERRFGRETDRVFILDDRFRMVAHADPRRRWEDLAGRGIASGMAGRLPRDVAYAADYGVGGEPMLGVMVPLSNLGWAVVVEQRARDAYAAVTTLWRTSLGVGLAAAVLAVGLGLILGRRLTRPVLAVARAARTVAGGDFSVEVESSAKDEVGEMARAFNTMARDLRAYRDQVIEETRIRTNLSRYLSAEVVDRVVREKEDLELGGERLEVTVLFADVVAFTPLAEKQSPEFVVGILNELFSFLTEIVFKHGGIVDKFIGDCVMAVFGAPYPVDDSALRAVRAAEEMMRWLAVGNAKWRKDLGRELQLAIGINTGEALAGNIGSKKRMEYTVIGDVVNVAARLESLARPGQVVMGPSTRAHVTEEFDTTSLGTHGITGRGEPMEIFVLEE